ncbi:MAG TPA: phosphatase PAP2 family protein [Nitrososphaeraceae archaeon]|jgi:undecaprenyl-diphosphatase|nr:phosphatase PAP2 family protein [Nitrososphaeraceae archaeon]
MVILSLFIIFTIFVHLRLFFPIDSFIFDNFSYYNPGQFLLYSFVIISSFGEVVNLIFVAILFTIIRRTRKMGMILMIAIMTIAISISYLKPIVAQPKPPESQKIPVLPKGFQLESDSLLTEARNFSYPSNHTAIITAFAYIVETVIRLKTKKYSFLWILPPMIMFSNLALGLNYLSDLIGGFLLGLIIAITLSRILKLEVPFLMNRFKGVSK